MGKVICVTNEKGGVGKTTLSINLARGLNQSGNKVLVIDADKQANSTDTLDPLERDFSKACMIDFENNVNPSLRRRLLYAVDRDSRAFDRYMAALALPKETEEERMARTCAMQEGLKEAALVPMEVAETVASLFPTLETVVRKGNARAVTDGMVGTMLARTAVLGALFNVRVNLESIRDSDFTAALSARADAAQELALSWEKRILSPIALAGKL